MFQLLLLAAILPCTVAVGKNLGGHVVKLQSALEKIEAGQEHNQLPSKLNLQSKSLQDTFGQYIQLLNFPLTTCNEFVKEVVAMKVGSCVPSIGPDNTITNYHSFLCTKDGTATLMSFRKEDGNCDGEIYRTQTAPVNSCVGGSLITCVDAVDLQYFEGPASIQYPDATSCGTDDFYAAQIITIADDNKNVCKNVPISAQTSTFKSSMTQCVSPTEIRTITYSETNCRGTSIETITTTHATPTCDSNNLVAGTTYVADYCFMKGWYSNL